MNQELAEMYRIEMNETYALKELEMQMVFAIKPIKKRNKTPYAIRCHKMITEDLGGTYWHVNNGEVAFGN